ncbi:MAG: cysteine--tRNA ligase [Clostridiales bacterium]|jgi:cysteinyl-tRNA synthetase|nr:cysteine--tRNA ligase [Clostridiales bacterium]
MLKLYNTLSREKEDFKPAAKTVTMYSCGPTVYNYAHIGNLRTYVFMDLLRRALKFDGYKIKGVMNITDVGHLLSDSDEGEDKMVKASRELKKSPAELAAAYAEAFFCDTAALNIGRPEIIAKATDHIKDMLDYVTELQKKGYAYETDDGIYFDIGAFPDYGKLSRANLDEQIAGARVEVNSQKRHPADFALWKKAEKNHIMQWDSPWGKGYPGWHIECSAMSRKYLGSAFDIHTGGVDHIPIHHENEIAQSEAREGKKTVNYWLHGEFMLVDGGKMSKSLGNTYTLSDLAARGYPPLAFRYFCLNTHYRKKLNFTFEGLAAAKTALERLCIQLTKHKNASANGADAKSGSVAGANASGADATSAGTSGTGADESKIETYQKEFADAINDDLNVPLALGVLWTMLKEPPCRKIYDIALKFDAVFGLDLHKSAELAAALTDEPQQEIPAAVAALAERRLAARAAKNWSLSDSLRDELKSNGWLILDAKDGTYTLKKE